MEPGDSLLDNDTSYELTAPEDSPQSQIINLTGQQEYWVYIYPDAGVASFGQVRTAPPTQYPRRSIPLPQTLASAHRRARSKLRKHAVAAQLRVCVTLTYEEEPENPIRDVDDFIANASSFYSGKFHWAVVTVLSEDGEHRTHHHVLIPRNIDIHKIVSAWGKGIVHVGFNPSDGDIRRTVNYVAHDFPKVPCARPRYRRSHGSTSEPIRLRASSLDEARSLAEGFVPRESNEAVVIHRLYGARGVVYWDVPRADNP